jgi:succinate dehydrogenase/fumarate reductase cytochrome b subunit
VLLFNTYFLTTDSLLLSIFVSAKSTFSLLFPKALITQYENLDFPKQQSILCDCMFVCICAHGSVCIYHQLFWFAIGSGKMRSQENLTIGKNVIS